MIAVWLVGAAVLEDEAGDPAAGQRRPPRTASGPPRRRPRRRSPRTREARRARAPRAPAAAGARRRGRPGVARRTSGRRSTRGGSRSAQSTVATACSAEAPRRIASSISARTASRRIRCTSKMEPTFGSIESARCDSSSPRDAARTARAEPLDLVRHRFRGDGRGPRRERDRLEVDRAPDPAAGRRGDAPEPPHASSPSEARNAVRASTAATASCPTALTSTRAPEGAAR